MFVARLVSVALLCVVQFAESAPTHEELLHRRELLEHPQQVFSSVKKKQPRRPESNALTPERLMRSGVSVDTAGFSASFHEGEGVQDVGVLGVPCDWRPCPDAGDASECSVDAAAMAPVQGDFPVDVVYTWIKQPSKEDYEQIAKDCPKLAGGWRRFRNLNTFRFSLRMLEKYMPWVRTIFIVTPGEAPDWLNTDHPKIRMIAQKDLWTKDQYAHDQPIHNSQPVEVHLHRIPGLAAHFIYFNDDMFVGRSLEKSFFFTDAGKPVLHLYRDPNFPMLRHRDYKWCQRAQPEHFPVTDSAHIPGAFSIPLIEDAQARWPHVFANISSAHCRGDIRVDWGPTYFYQWFGWQSGLIEIQEPVSMAFLNDQVKDRHAWYQKTLSERPYVGCINDDFDVANDTRFVEEKNELVAFMADYSAAYQGSWSAWFSSQWSWLMDFMSRGSTIRDTQMSLLTLDKELGVVEVLIEQEGAKSS